MPVVLKLSPGLKLEMSDDEALEVVAQITAMLINKKPNVNVIEDAAKGPRKYRRKQKKIFQRNGQPTFLTKAAAYIATLPVGEKIDKEAFVHAVGCKKGSLYWYIRKLQKMRKLSMTSYGVYAVAA